MTVYGKVWGATKPLLVTPTVEVHEIDIVPNAHCSVHKHNHKHNAFYVIKGQLQICVRKNNYDLVDITVLNPGDFTTVPPGEYHWFQTTDSIVKALEIYYIEPLSEDIIRETIGGVD